MLCWFRPERNGVCKSPSHCLNCYRIARVHLLRSSPPVQFVESAQPGSTLFMPVNRQIRSCAFFRILLPVFIVMCTAQLVATGNNGFIFASHVPGKNKTIIARCHELRGKHHDLRTATRGLFVQSKSYRKVDLALTLGI